MDTQAFWKSVESIAEEYNIGRHPLVKLIKESFSKRSAVRLSCTGKAGTPCCNSWNSCNRHPV